MRQEESNADAQKIQAGISVDGLVGTSIMVNKMTWIYFLRFACLSLFKINSMFRSRGSEEGTAGSVSDDGDGDCSGIDCGGIDCSDGDCGGIDCSDGDCGGIDCSDGDCGSVSPFFMMVGILEERVFGGL